MGVVGASEGYPGSYEKGHVITGLSAAEKVQDCIVFHAGTRMGSSGPETCGGRVLCATSLGDSLDEARERAYASYDAIRWSGKFCRRDIGLARPNRYGTPGAGFEEGVDFVEDDPQGAVVSRPTQ